jgi:hypothetical protein
MTDTVLTIIIPGVLVITVTAWLFAVIAWLRRR